MGRLAVVLARQVEIYCKYAVTAVVRSTMFVVGYRWAKYTNANPLKTGVSMALIGLALVLIAVALG